jgi:hypothetical protein
LVGGGMINMFEDVFHNDAGHAIDRPHMPAADPERNEHFTVQTSEAVPPVAQLADVRPLAALDRDRDRLHRPRYAAHRDRQAAGRRAGAARDAAVRRSEGVETVRAPSQPGQFSARYSRSS